MRESVIQTAILRYLRKTYPDAVVIKVSTELTCSGVPDIFFLKDSVLYMMEVKAKRGVVSKIQKYMLGRFKKAGAQVSVVRSVNDVKRVMGE